MSTSSDTSGSRMQALLRCEDGRGWKQLLLETRVGGLPLLQRQLLGLRQAGITDVCLAVPASALAEVERDVEACVPSGVSLSVSADHGCARLRRPETSRGADIGGVEGSESTANRTSVLVQRADTLVDPRLLAQVVRFHALHDCDVICLDDERGGNTPEAKSPYRVGVPEIDEARPVDAAATETLTPIGVAVLNGVGTQLADFESVIQIRHREVESRPHSTAVGLNIGRYYWHQLVSPADAGAATWKVLLATMKATDGVFARTNRRLSLRISRLLVGTRTTPNMVTLATLLLGVLSGWLLSRGDQPTFVAGSLIAWFASMLDGVDGELARAKFQSSSFGHWLEMVCDYAFYMAIFIGLGAGVQRRHDGDPIWLFLGLGAAAGVVVSFAVVAYIKRAYGKRGNAGSFYLGYQRTMSAPGSSWLRRVMPYLLSMCTRAGFPYVLFLISLFDMPRGMLITIFISTHGFWMVALYTSRLAIRLEPASQPAVADTGILLPIDPEIQSERARNRVEEVAEQR